MHLVIVHYHLNRGGVTRVVENQLRALATLASADQPHQVTVAFGGRRAAWDEGLVTTLPFPVQLVAVPELEYDSLKSHCGRSLATALRSVLAAEGATAQDTVVHLHNHGLGKNREMLPAVIELTGEGWRFLLQIHDFAEDLRPANYRHLLEATTLQQLQAQLYPQAGQIHYAVLNTRDREVLTAAGMAPARLHLLPNPVSVPRHVEALSQSTARAAIQRRGLDLDDRRYVIYPVRAIRRKNLGELLLWSQVVDQTVFAVTLAPLNEAERPNYDRWRSLAKHLSLPIWFDVASHGVPLAESYAASDGILTTSVAEGFGLVFLEAALASRPLWGRRLSGVVDDFEAVGMHFPGLQDSFRIPSRWIDCDALRRLHEDQLQQLRGSFGLAPTPDGGTDYLFDGNTIDFGRLGANGQQEVIQRLATNGSDRRELVKLNPMVQQASETPRMTDFACNREVIREHYGVERIATQLLTIYRRLLDASAQPVECRPAIGHAVLEQFLQPDHLFPIRLPE